MSARRLSMLAAAILVLGPLALPARSAEAVFETPSADSTYGTAVAFAQPVTLSAAPKRVEILLEFPDAPGPSVVEVPTSASGAQTLRYAILMSDAQLLPNTPIKARWRITPGAGPPEVGPAVTVLYTDTTKQWQTLDGSLIRLHWYSGSTEFAQQALAAGERGVAKASQLLGVTETKPIDFFVYADGASFCTALVYGPTCNVAGRSIASTRTMFGRIPPSQVASAQVARVIPHELTHLVFNTATQNPYHTPPDWLNEGLAVYLSEGNAPYYRAALADAVGSGTLQPLTAFTLSFPPETLYDRFTLAYAEAVSAVDFMVRTYGRPALVALIRSYAAGRTDDEAFSAAIGVNVAGFEAAWLAGLGALAPARYGPQPAPTGPLPPGWNVAIPQPGQEMAPGGTAAAGPVATASPASSVASTSGDGSSGGTVLVAIGAAGLGLGVLLGYLRRRRTRPPPGASGAEPPEAWP
jgi:hypothetical protein